MHALTTIHIIEPTLQNETGHCCGYVTSLLESASKANVSLELWIGKAARNLFAANIKVHAWFYPKLRKIQTYLLYRYLLKKQQPIFVPTAGRTDLLMLHWLVKKNQHHKIFLHFHQFTLTPKKQQLLQKIAALHPEFTIFAPTNKLLAIFKQAGFKDCQVIPCPTYQRETAQVKTTGEFKQILYAGAARQDKGFTAVVDLINYLQQQPSQWPITLQISPNHTGKYSPAIQQALIQLEHNKYSHLTTYKHSLSKTAYQNLFQDAIALQLYDNQSYGDKFSGVTLDALYAGCPIITTANTWIADTIERFSAGQVIHDTKPTTVYAALATIIANFRILQANALYAGKILRNEHDPINTLEAIKKRLT